MTAGQTIEKVLKAAAPSGGESIDRIESNLKDWGISLPSVHVSLLAKSNGLVGYHGYFRLFAAGPPGSNSRLASLRTWNDKGTWKFAWPAHVADYCSFGETAWGDQYAYKFTDLKGPSTPVYFLEALTLEPEEIATSFESFLRDEFLRNCTKPYDSKIIDAVERFGNLDPTEHLAHVPSPLITGDESRGDVMKMNAVAHMIVNGDLASQIADEPESRKIKRIDVSRDSSGRERLRVVWDDD